MMQVPDHLSVTGVELRSIDFNLSSWVTKLESARSAIIEKMSVPEHITINGSQTTVVPSQLPQLRNSQIRMEVPNKLNVFDLTETEISQTIQSSSKTQSVASSNLENPYEEAKVLNKRLVIVLDRLKLLENQIEVQKRREKMLLLALIGAAITMAWSHLRR